VSRTQSFTEGAEEKHTEENAQTKNTQRNTRVMTLQ